jgi:hypothetical protein
VTYFVDMPDQSSSNFNLESLNSAQFEKHLSASIAAGSNLAIIGRRGSGKTAISQQQIKIADHHEAYMNLSVYERADFGYPKLFGQDHKEGKEQFVSYMLPHIFEPMLYGEKPVVLLLDEVDKADKSLWAPLLEITQAKSINGRKLPLLKSVIMTGNLIAEGGEKPSAPLLDRTEAYSLEPSARYWLAWAAISGEIHPAVSQFITDQGDNALFGPIDGGENYKDASPRGWHLASKILFFGEAHNWEFHLLTEKICGIVGKKAGLDFRIYLSSYKVLLPIVDMIFNQGDYQTDWKKLSPTEKLYATTIVCSRFAKQLDAGTPDHPPSSIETVGKFFQSCGYENVLMGIRSQLKVSRILRYDLDTNPHWSEILTTIKSSVPDAV